MQSEGRGLSVTRPRPIDHTLLIEDFPDAERQLLRRHIVLLGAHRAHEFIPAHNIIALTRRSNKVDFLHEQRCSAALLAAHNLAAPRILPITFLDDLHDILLVYRKSEYRTYVLALHSGQVNQ